MSAILDTDFIIEKIERVSAPDTDIDLTKWFIRLADGTRFVLEQDTTAIVTYLNSAAELKTYLEAQVDAIL